MPEIHITIQIEIWLISVTPFYGTGGIKHTQSKSSIHLVESSPEVQCGASEYFQEYLCKQCELNGTQKSEEAMWL